MSKPLQVNPHKLSPVMGAHLACLGVDGVMPIIHGAQGCSNFSKVFFTRHFSEPIVSHSTAVNDITAVLDGGACVAEAIELLAKKSPFKLAAIITTGLTETKGDDVKGAINQLSYPALYFPTPDYEGGLEEGFALAIEVFIKERMVSVTTSDPKLALILPHASMTPLEVEKLKEFLEDFGVRALALPDLSGSLDGHLEERQGSVAKGGITLEEIEEASGAGMILSIGESTRKARQAFLAKNPSAFDLNVESLYGLRSSDALVRALMDWTGHEPSVRIKRWRARLQDMMLDSHFALGGKRVIAALENDHLLGISKILEEVGMSFELAVATTGGPAMTKISAKEAVVGDLEHLMQNIELSEVVIACERLGGFLPKETPWLVRGYPIFERIGTGLGNDILYEGGCYLLKELANLFLKEHQAHD